MGRHARELASFDIVGRDWGVVKKAKLIVVPGMVVQQVILVWKANPYR